MWMLKVQVGSQSISPLYWAIQSGAVDSATAMIKDLLVIRADRDRYYYGAQDLFTRHPDIVKRLADDAPTLLPVLFDGLIWRSRTNDSGTRRVNYYIKHLLLDEEGNFNKTLDWMARTRDPKLVCHTVMCVMSDLVWAHVASRRFLYGKSWFLFTLLLFISSQSLLEHLDSDDSSLERVLVFACRCFIYGCSMLQLLYAQSIKFYDSLKQHEFNTVLCLKIPKHLENWTDSASVALVFALFMMLVLEPILWCWEVGIKTGKLFEGSCPEAEGVTERYSVFCMIAMFLYYALLVDLAVFSMRISAFVLVCGRMVAELGLFVLAICAVTLTFSASISVVKHDADEFKGIHVGALALFRMVLRMYSGERFNMFWGEWAVSFTVSVFLVMTLVFLFNLLIAQLTCAYSTIYEDMVGYARLKRIRIIVDTMPSVSKRRWQRFLDALRLDKRIEFNEGDIGLKGGIQVKEPASANPTTVDMIRRFGGSTSQETQWPEEDTNEAGDDDERFDRMERTLQQALQKVNSKTKTDRDGSGVSGSSSASGKNSGGGTGDANIASGSED